MKKALEEEILRSIEEIMPQLSHIAKTLYENPEIGGEEKLASRLLCEFLTENGLLRGEGLLENTSCFQSCL